MNDRDIEIVGKVKNKKLEMLDEKLPALIPHDINLLELIRTQWKYGDWDSLSKHEYGLLQHHPEREKLITYAASGLLQMGQIEKARDYINKAINWGCNRELLFRIIISGIYNSLGRVSAIRNEGKSALNFFSQSVNIGLNDLKSDLITRSRFLEQLRQLNSYSNDVILKSVNCGFFVENYFIKNGYEARSEYAHYDDLEEEDEWQLEIYLRAYGLMKKNKWKIVADIGCGSGYKLINYLGEFVTIGYELPMNISELKRRYPSRNWKISNFDIYDEIGAQLIICSDVIEHLVDPDQLMNYLKHQNWELLILSTPERDICRGVDDFGPPKNISHQREWSFEEFYKYVSKYFVVIEHSVVNFKQGTQMIVCKNVKNLISGGLRL